MMLQYNGETFHHDGSEYINPECPHCAETFDPCACVREVMDEERIERALVNPDKPGTPNPLWETSPLAR